MRSLLIGPRFTKDFKQLPLVIQDQVERAVNILRANPVAPNLNIRKLKNIKPAVWRVRFNVYRLIYSFTAAELILHRAGHRRDIYRHL